MRALLFALTALMITACSHSNSNSSSTPPDPTDPATLTTLDRAGQSLSREESFKGVGIRECVATDVGLLTNVEKDLQSIQGQSKPYWDAFQADQKNMDGLQQASTILQNGIYECNRVKATIDGTCSIDEVTYRYSRVKILCAAEELEYLAEKLVLVRY